MIVSMTGFGDATTEKDGTHYSVEIRSLNNRFFKAVIKLPDNVAGLEPELEGLLREQLGRGSITYILKMRTESAEAAYHINTQLAAMRVREGEGLFADLLKHLQVIRVNLAEIATRAPHVIDEYHKRLAQ